MTRPYDFDLFIAAANDTFTVQARATRGGELPAQPLTLPFNPARLPDRRRDVAEWIRYARETRLRGPEELREARMFGKALFDSLFTDELLAAFRASRSTLAPGERLRIRLRLPPALVGVPWELLYDQYNNQFLALAPDLTLVRYPEMPAAHAQPGPLRVEGPLQVVVVLASPTDEYYPRLRLDRELGRLEHALKLLRDKNQVQLDVIRGPGTLDQLRERMRQPVHILHILSHGDLNRETGEGELLFEDTDGAAEPINAELLRRYLERQRGQVQLVTLNACLGALPVENDPFSSVGLSLIRGGVPAVVAMQFEIAEDVAAELTRVLYAELAAGTPIDRALSETRLDISGRYRTRLDWAIPVLFSRAETGVLFDFTTSRNNPTEEVNHQTRSVRTEKQPAPFQLIPLKRIHRLLLTGTGIVAMLILMTTLIWDMSIYTPSREPTAVTDQATRETEMSGTAAAAQSEAEQATVQAIAIEETVAANQAIRETEMSGTVVAEQTRMARVEPTPTIAVPTSTVAANTEYQLLQDARTWIPFFVDTFTNNTADWFTGRYNNPRVDGDIQVANGVHLWRFTALQQTTWWLRPTTSELGDFYLTAEMQKTSGPTDSSYGLIFRLQEGEGFRYYRFMITDQQKYEIARVDEQVTVLKDWTSTSSIRATGGNRLSVIGLGSTFTFYINGQYIAEITDNHLSTGQFGIIAGLEAGSTVELETLSFEVRAP